jgi:hypothetical protein
MLSGLPFCVTGIGAHRSVSVQISCADVLQYSRGHDSLCSSSDGEPGAHYCEDYLSSDERWLGSLHVAKADDQLEVDFVAKGTQ